MGEIYVDGDNEDEISGVLECEIHAEILSTPIKDRYAGQDQGN